MTSFFTQGLASIRRSRRGGPASSRMGRDGFTLVELMVAVGLFAVVMLLSSGAYLMMIGLNQQAQNVTTGIDNLSFALETMTRNIRTGAAYSCGALGGDCTTGGTSFTFINQQGTTVTYSMSGSSLIQTVGGVQSALTDASVTITALTFYVFGTMTTAQADYEQPRVSITVSGTVSAGPNRPVQSFTVESSATMRGTDLGASSGPSPAVGQQAYTIPGTYSWVAPASVTSVSVVCVGSGGNGQSSGNLYGGGGGALAYANNVSVTPGNSYAVVVAAGGDQSYSSFGGSTVKAGSGSNSGVGGTVLNGTGGPGGPANIGTYSGGGGGGGYSGAGGAGGYSYSVPPTSGSGGGGSGGGSDFINNAGGGGGGGVGILGEGTNGVALLGPWGASFGNAAGAGGGGSGGANGGGGQPAGNGGNGGDGGFYGGGGGAGMLQQPSTYNPGGAGAGGACRIIWPGTTRQFPSTGTADQ